ncbi:MAG: TusE/DsrC/DsvC family sulfur relay protein [Thiobacillus sp.]
MFHLSSDITSWLRDAATDPQFPDAPLDWTRADAERIAQEEGLTLTADHWEAIRALQHYYARHQDIGPINLRELHDALDEHFHARGGLKLLYTLFPAGPIAQSCRLAGLKAPFIAADRGFGSAA